VSVLGIVLLREEDFVDMVVSCLSPYRLSFQLVGWVRDLDCIEYFIEKSNIICRGLDVDGTVVGGSSKDVNKEERLDDTADEDDNNDSEVVSAVGTETETFRIGELHPFTMQ
jgi:hypothetical protein